VSEQSRGYARDRDSPRMMNLQVIRCLL